MSTHDPYRSEILPRTVLDKLPAYLVEGVENFTSMQWFKRNRKEYVNLYGPSPIYFGSYDLSVFTYEKSYLAPNINSEFLFKPDFIKETKQKDKMKTLSDVRATLSVKLEEKWGSGDLVEQYMYGAMSSNIHVDELSEASPIILTCIASGRSDVERKYKNVPLGVEYKLLQPKVVVKIAALTDDPTIFNEFLKLPVDTLEAL